jgi:hypothetical protein
MRAARMLDIYHWEPNANSMKNGQIIDEGCLWQGARSRDALRGRSDAI